MIVEKGMKLFHKKFGEGVVLSVKKAENGLEEFWEIQFGNEKKTMRYPDCVAGDGFAFDDVSIYASAAQLQQRLDEARQQQNEYVEPSTIVREEPRRQRRERREPTTRRQQGTTRSADRTPSSIAFKCNYCDGKINGNIGFSNPCSDEIIRIRQRSVSKTNWCRTTQSKCKDYIEGRITRQELENEFNKADGFICYECKALIDWTMKAGTDVYGLNNVPRRFGNDPQNRLAVLTTRLPNSVESERIIFAAYICDTVYIGDTVDAGTAQCVDDRYRIQLSEDEAKRILFWNYYSNPKSPRTVQLGSRLYRWLTDAQAVQILKDIVDVKQGAEKQLAQRILDKYCETIGLDPATVPPKAGALTL